MFSKRSAEVPIAAQVSSNLLVYSAGQWANHCGSTLEVSLSHTKVSRRDPENVSRTPPQAPIAVTCSLAPEDSAAQGLTDDAKRWRLEAELFFTNVPVLMAECEETVAPAEPPFLMYCPPSCLTSAIKKHERLVHSNGALQFRQLSGNKKEDGQQGEGTEEGEEYKVVDVGERYVLDVYVS